MGLNRTAVFGVLAMMLVLGSVSASGVCTSSNSTIEALCSNVTIMQSNIATLSNTINALNANVIYLQSNSMATSNSLSNISNSLSIVSNDLAMQGNYLDALAANQINVSTFNSAMAKVNANLSSALDGSIGNEINGINTNATNALNTANSANSKVSSIQANSSLALKQSSQALSTENGQANVTDQKFGTTNGNITSADRAIAALQQQVNVSNPNSKVGQSIGGAGFTADLGLVIAIISILMGFFVFPRLNKAGTPPADNLDKVLAGEQGAKAVKATNLDKNAKEMAAAEAAKKSAEETEKQKAAMLADPEYQKARKALETKLKQIKKAKPKLTVETEALSEFKQLKTIMAKYGVNLTGGNKGNGDGSTS